MPVTLSSPKISVSITNIVNSSLKSIKSARSEDRSKKEAAFQKAVAGGMSYSAQADFRKKQMEEERLSSFKDDDYIRELEVSVANTEKLAKFEKVRSKYKQSIDDYVMGKESLQAHIDMLQSSIDANQDPDINNELRTLMSTALQEKSTIELNAIKNRAIVAQKDNSQQLIDNSISEITSKKALASINGSDDEVATWDETLIALNSAKSKLKIEDGINEINFQINKNNLKTNEKLNLLNNYVNSSDTTGEVIYGGVTYPSLKSYWENARGEYLSTSYFNEVEKELNDETVKMSALNGNGQIPVARIDAVDKFYKTLQTKPEFTLYIDTIEQKRVGVVNTMITELTDSVYNEADDAISKDPDNQETYIKKADTTIGKLETKFGIKLNRTSADATTKVANQVSKETAAVETAGLPSSPSSSGTDRVVAAGETLSKIASENNMSLNTLLEMNPQYKSNPNVVKQGAVLKLNTSPTAKITTPLAGNKPSISEINETKETDIKSAVMPRSQESPAPASAPIQNNTVKEHVVKPGDNLSSLAKTYLGDSNRAFELVASDGTKYDANTAKKLKIGTKLIIPTA